MDDRERILLGAIGAICVGAATYPITDYVFTPHDPNTWWAVAGWAARLGVLALIGGLWAYLHRSETDRMRVFQLGIMAPAALTAVLSANGVGAPAAPFTVDEPAVSRSAAAPGRTQGSGLFTIISPAHAQSDGNRPSPADGSRKPSPWDSFIRGALGTGK